MEFFMNLLANPMELIGWLGGILLSVCGVPLAWQAYKDGHANGLNWLFIHLWFWGEVFVLIYVFPEMLLPLIANYSFNIIIVLVLLRYKMWPRTSHLKDK